MIRHIHYVFMKIATPTIKGIFVTAHVRAVRKSLGEEGVRRLEQTYGAPLSFGLGDPVLLKDEARLLECAVNLLAQKEIPPEVCSYEAGRLHFKNFRSTPLGRIVFPYFRRRTKHIFLRPRLITGYIFTGIEFRTKEIAPDLIRLRISNCGYPLAHWRGFFDAWLTHCGYSTPIIGDQDNQGGYALTINLRTRISV